MQYFFVCYLYSPFENDFYMLVYVTFGVRLGAARGGGEAVGAVRSSHYVLFFY